MLRRFEGPSIRRNLHKCFEIAKLSINILKPTESSKSRQDIQDSPKLEKFKGQEYIFRVSSKYRITFESIRRIPERVTACNTINNLAVSSSGTLLPPQKLPRARADSRESSVHLSMYSFCKNVTQ